MKAVVSGVIALLLGIYCYFIWLGGKIVSCVNTSGCMSYTAAMFNDSIAQTLSFIGGLVSALVIAELAITKPGEPPVARVLAASASNKAKNVLRWVTGAYLAVWIAAGLSAFLVGVNHPNTLPPLTNVGQSWFGLAITATYTYFGVNPQQP